MEVENLELTEIFDTSQFNSVLTYRWKGLIGLKTFLHVWYPHKKESVTMIQQQNVDYEDKWYTEFLFIVGFRVSWT